MKNILIYIYNNLIELGMGKYRLTEGFEHHFMTPAQWKTMDPDAKTMKIRSYFESSAKKTTAKYKKPQNAGQKSNKSQKRRKQEPELFVNPMKLSKKGVEDWQVDNAVDENILDPDRETIPSSFLLVLRNDSQNCPKAVKRCESCRVNFLNDIVVVKTCGKRSYFDSKS